VTGHQGAGSLTGLKTKIPAKQVQKTLLDQHDILTGTSGDANVLRLLPPFILKESDVDLLAAALAKIPA
jgi:acetylornithine/succinyldiaminopimelate/putrescine aminotransferase